MTTMPEWETVERPDGSFEIRRTPGEDSGAPGEPPLLGIARITELGWIAETTSGRSYGPFTSLSEAAYPLALLADGHDAHLLLGAPLPPPGSRPVRTPALAAAPSPAHERRNRRLLSAALLALAVVAIVADRRGSRP